MNMEGILGSEFMDRAESRRRDARIKDKTDGSRRRDSGPSFEAKKAMLMQRIQEMRDMATPGMSPAPMPSPMAQMPLPNSNHMFQLGTDMPRPAPMPMPMQAGMTTFPNIDYLRRMGAGQPPAMPMPMPQPGVPPNTTVIPRQPMQDRPGQWPIPPVMPPNTTVIPPNPPAPVDPVPVGPRGDRESMAPRGLLASTPPMPPRPMSAPSLPFENAPEIAQGKFETFREAFRDARKSGKKTFMWNGKKYTTKLKK